MATVMGEVHDPGHFPLGASALQTGHVNFIDAEKRK